MKILLLSDIHGNFPALQAIVTHFKNTSFNAICNCGDSTVYAPFPNETLHWLKANKVYSILGNTDRKVKKILCGKIFKKPKKIEKRIMYTWTASQLTTTSKNYLYSLRKSHTLTTRYADICLFHGSPEHPNEFLFPNTAPTRFAELASSCSCPVIVTGHSHTPYHKQVGDTHFINPGSVGRMFDSNPTSSCAVLTLNRTKIEVTHYRIPYPIHETTRELARLNFPEIYQKMYQLGQKLN
jgi:putative phosphoesterase